MPFPDIPPVLMAIVSVAGAVAVLTWRVRETMRPVSIAKIIVPPVAMSTGFAMFAVQATRVPLWWAAAAFLLGALILVIPVQRSSALVRRGGEILLQPSRMFLWILIGLVAVRFGLRAYMERLMTPIQTGSLIFVLAFGTIVRWRAAMLRDYLRLRREA